MPFPVVDRFNPRAGPELRLLALTAGVGITVFMVAVLAGSRVNSHALPADAFVTVLLPSAAKLTLTSPRDPSPHERPAKQGPRVTPFQARSVNAKLPTMTVRDTDLPDALSETEPPGEPTEPKSERPLDIGSTVMRDAAIAAESELGRMLRSQRALAARSGRGAEGLSVAIQRSGRPDCWESNSGASLADLPLWLGRWIAGQCAK
jgi:hypothetical protein